MSAGALPGNAGHSIGLSPAADLRSHEGIGPAPATRIVLASTESPRVPGRLAAATVQDLRVPEAECPSDGRHDRPQGWLGSRPCPVGCSTRQLRRDVIITGRGS